MSSLSKATLFGWFVKGVVEGKSGRPRRRFFTLRGTTMKYFANCDDDNQGVDPKGHIRISEHTQVLDDRNSGEH